MLHDNQKKFMAHLFDKDNTDILSEIETDARFSAAQRLQIYQNNLVFILEDSLKNIFPICCRMVSDDFFAYAIRQYIALYPPQSGDMSFYGDTFATFLQSFEPVKAHGYLPDLAQLEWLRYCASQHDPKTSFDPNVLNALTDADIPELSFRFQPHVFFMHSAYAVDSLWDAVYTGKTDILDKINITNEKYLFIFRHAGDVIFSAQSPAAYSFAHSLAQGQIFAEALDKALEKDPDFQAQETLAYFFRNQMLCADE